eukprot:3163232-Amphidinium_carterae.1
MQQITDAPESAGQATGSGVPPTGQELDGDGQPIVRQEGSEQTLVPIGTPRNLTPRIARGIDDSDMLS